MIKVGLVKILHSLGLLLQNYLLCDQKRDSPDSILEEDFSL